MLDAKRAKKAAMMKLQRRKLLGLALLGGLGRAAIAKPAAPATRTVEQELAAIANEPACRMASLSVLVIKNGKVAFEHQLGQRILPMGDVAAQPVTPATMFRIASISKMVTTIGAMLLVEKGKLDLDRDASDYLGFQLRNPHFPERPVTLRALLSHTSSLRDGAGYSFPATTPLASVLVPGAQQYGKGDMWASNAAPDEFFTYSNLNWGVIGTMMEMVSGERFDRLMRRTVLGPLGMAGGYNPSEFSPAELANLATLYRKRTTDTEIWDPEGPWIAQVDDFSKRAPQRPVDIDAYVIGTNATPFSPTGGLRVSPADMGKLMLMMMNNGRHEGRVFLQPSSLAAMLKRHWTDDGKNGDTENGLFGAWGLGNQHFTGMDETRKFNAVGHLGEAYGLYSVFAADLTKKNGIIAFTGGTTSDPELHKGKYSSLVRFEEQLVSTLYRRVIK
jgi:CubicO group peptidase (beta-lactamase class C family)